METKLIVQKFYQEMWNKWDFNYARKIMTPDILFRGSLGVDVKGQEDFVRYMRLVQKAFPDFYNEVQELVGEGNKVFAKLLYSGTHRGPLFDISATGRKICYSGAALFTFHESLITQVWVLGDRFGLLEQLKNTTPTTVTTGLTLNSPDGISR